MPNIRVLMQDIKDRDKTIAELKKAVKSEQGVTEMVRASRTRARDTRDRYRRELTATQAKLLQAEVANLPKAVPLSNRQTALMNVGYTLFPGDAEMQQLLRDIVTDASMGETLLALHERGGMSDLTMLLAGVGMNMAARKAVDEMLDARWAGRTARDVFVERPPTQELVIGSGVHAAIFAAIRHQKTGQKITVVEKASRAGGAFAVSQGPAFFLNSRNRPGGLSVPGDEFGALNVLPGAPLQPSDMSGEQYLSNDLLAWVVRMTLLMYAEVHTGIELNVQSYNSERCIVKDDGGSWYSGKTFIATGLGKAKKAFDLASDAYMTFNEFMARMDLPFPLRDMRRVAVLGAGDGGKTVIEALTGQGPAPGLSAASLDYVQQIDWYGVPQTCRNRPDWERQSRNRYKGIGVLLQNGGYEEDYEDGDDRRFVPDQKTPRVQTFATPTYAEVGYDSVRVEGLPYDCVIDCTGYDRVRNYEFEPDYYYEGGRSTNPTLALASRPAYVMGPGAALQTDRWEGGRLRGIPENATSIFRYADKTARLAQIA